MEQKVNYIEKPFLVFGPARSGTSLLMSIIKGYSKQRHTISEYFNLDEYVIIDDGNGLTREFFGDGTKILISSRDQEIKNRLQLLEKYHYLNIPIKILSSQITDAIFDYVKDKYLIILIERKDTYDQLLSWIIAMHTNVWNIDIYETLTPPPKFIANFSHINRFFELLQRYQYQKREFLKNSDTIQFYYDEVECNDNFKKIVEKFGFNYDNRKIPNLQKKLYTLTEKETLILNLDEIKKEYTRIHNEIYQ